MTDIREDNDGYRRFREALQDGRLKAGMVVTQNELCELLGLSLSPLRETLVLLEEFGLVEIKPRTGIRIVYPEVAFIRENAQFRIMIELHALKTCGDMVSVDWLANAREKHEERRAQLLVDGDFEQLKTDLLLLDRQFHRDIVSLLENNAISSTHARLQDNLGMARRVHQAGIFRNQLVATMDEHLRVISALETRDVAAAVEALEAHFRASSHRTFAAN